MNRHVALPRWWPALLVVPAGGLIAHRHFAMARATGDTGSAVAAGGESGSAVAVLAGGCYWGVASVFRHVRGISSVTSGFANPVPAAGAPSAGAAEAVRIVYDPSRISYRQLLGVFFSVVHDPTQLNRQGPDVGAEYRSVVFAGNDAERRAAQAYIDSLTAARAFPRPIVTRIAALQSFDTAVPSQQNYAEQHPTDPYIVRNDVPKVAALQQKFPRLYKD